MRVLIIGGTGVLGRAVVKFAVNAGYEVTMLTDGLGELLEPIGIKQHLEVDRNNDVAFQQALAQTEVTTWDLVIDVICRSITQAKSLFKAIQGKSQHTIIISTAILYDHSQFKILNPDDPIAPLKEFSDYCLGKIGMEQFWLKAWQEEHHPVTILRPPHILGEGCLLGIIPLHNREPHLIRRILSQKPLLLADGGRQTLQVVFNEDVAKVIFAAHGKTATYGKVYNCANPELLTGRSYFEAISNLLGQPLIIKSVPSESIWSSTWGWVQTTFPRILCMESLATDIGFVPDTPLTQSIETTLHFLMVKEIINIKTIVRFLILKKIIHFEVDYLQSIEDVLDQNQSLLEKVLSDSARLRPKPPIDVRMNTKTESG
jgi:nucleoside-diphosphate-sugar epimerase